MFLKSSQHEYSRLVQLIHRASAILILALVPMGFAMLMCKQGKKAMDKTQKLVDRIKNIKNLKE